MAAIEVVQLDSKLVAFPAAVVTADTVTNNTNGLLTICIGETITSGSGKLITEKAGTEQTILPGGASTAVTVGAGEGVYIKNTREAMASTVDGISAVLA